MYVKGCFCVLRKQSYQLSHPTNPSGIYSNRRVTSTGERHGLDPWVLHLSFPAKDRFMELWFTHSRLQSAIPDDTRPLQRFLLHVQWELAFDCLGRVPTSTSIFSMNLYGTQGHPASVYSRIPLDDLVGDEGLEPPTLTL